MGMFDNLKKKAEKAVNEHGDKIAEGIDKAAGVADARTKGKHSGQIGRGASAAKDALDRLDGRNDDIPDDKPGHKPGHKPGGRPGR